MSVIARLDQLLLQPLTLLCHELFVAINAGFPGPGYSLIALGILINLLLLPLYFQMERNGRAEKEAQARVDNEVRRIKANFSGREAYYYIKTTYRVHNYSPLRVVFQSTDLLVQVIVFSTLYRYLAQLKALQGAAFGPITDLGQPDGLLWGINLLPIIMTATNLLSVFAYEPRKRKQGVLLALLFLALLYRSPSGLVVYWTSSNVFSWLRNVAIRWIVPRLPQELIARGKSWVNQQ